MRQAKFIQNINLCDILLVIWNRYSHLKLSSALFFRSALGDSRICCTHDFRQMSELISYNPNKENLKVKQITKN